MMTCPWYVLKLTKLINFCVTILTNRVACLMTRSPSLDIWTLSSTVTGAPFFNQYNCANGAACGGSHLNVTGAYCFAS